MVPLTSATAPLYGPCVFGLQLTGVYAIVLYHIWPSEFGNGFMGVDISVSRGLCSIFGLSPSNCNFFWHSLRRSFCSSNSAQNSFGVVLFCPLIIQLSALFVLLVVPSFLFWRLAPSNSVAMG
ncbi:hypothetical protein niasHT_002500 [Heterodera trifolii]|uniref:Uncharacterized protein n=1 Tax=Heterodera trifolii TaxID=157864 RepID=A0ABD2MB53_9BILA